MFKMYGDALFKKHKSIFLCSDYISNKNNVWQVFLKPTRFFWGYIERFFSMFHLNSPGFKMNKFYLFVYTSFFYLDYLQANLTLTIKLFFKLRREAVNNFVVIDGHYLLAGYFLSRLKRSKFYYALYEIWPEEFVIDNVIKLSSKIAKSKIECCLCNKVDRNIVVNPVWSKLIRRRYGLYSNKFVVIPVCPRKVDLPNNVMSIEKVVKFHYHGAYFKSRGILELIKAFSSIDNAQLYLRGVGPDEEYFKEVVKNENLSNKVFFLDSVEVGELVIASVDFDVGVILAMPDTINGRMCTGFKCYEYVNSGLALFAPSSYPLNYYIKRYQCGVNYGWPSESNFISEINKLVDDFSTIEKYKSNSRKIRNKYCSEIQAEKFLNLMGY